MNRRDFLTQLSAWTGLAMLAPPAWAIMPDSPMPSETVALTGEQSDHFRAWLSFIIADQIKRGPSPRWFHRDCAGLLRFAVNETLRPHDAKWREANGFEGKRLPPELLLSHAQADALKGWVTFSGERQAFVTAAALIQKNTRFIGRDTYQARPGDLLFFDQGDDQHLMIWMRDWVAYHTGQTPVIAPAKKTVSTKHTSEPQNDNGLRAVTPLQLMHWKDTRWRLRDDNPNFSGFYRLAFLSR